MTPETIAITILLGLLCSVVAILLAGKGKVSKEDFERHKEAVVPHLACPAHSTKLEEVERRLENIEGKIDTLLDKVK